MVFEDAESAAPVPARKSTWPMNELDEDEVMAWT